MVYKLNCLFGGQALISHGNKTKYITTFKNVDLPSFDKTLGQYKWKKNAEDQGVIDALALMNVEPFLPKERIFDVLIPQIDMQTIAIWVYGITRLFRTILGIDLILGAPARMEYDYHYLLRDYKGLFEKFWSLCLLVSDRIFSRKLIPLSIFTVLVVIRVSLVAISYITERARAFLPDAAATASLSALANNGKLSRHSKIIGREQELKNIVQALTVGQHVFLCGPAGCGKTALVEELVQMIQRGEVDSLKDKTVDMYNGARLSGISSSDECIGTQFDTLLNSIRVSPEVYKNRIFFFDEIHAASDAIRQELKSNTDGSNFPLIIVATTNEELEKMGSDKAFLDRFSKVQVKPLSADCLVELLQSEYGTVAEKEVFQMAVDRFSDTQNHHSLRSVIRLFSIASGKLKTCDDAEINTSIRRKESACEKLRQQLEQVLRSNASDVSDLRTRLQEASMELQEMKQKRIKLQKNFRHLSELSDKIDQIFSKMVREAKKADKDESFILCAYYVALPALKEKYEEAKQQYTTEFGVKFYDKISQQLIQEVLEIEGS